MEVAMLKLESPVVAEGKVENDAALLIETFGKKKTFVVLYTVEPLNKGHLGTQAAVPYSEVVPYWEVRDKTVLLQHQ